MLTIRLKSEGKKHQKTMRIVVIDSRKSSISNRYIEKIGWWIPADHKHEINKEKALYWISKGAKPSVTVFNLFIEDKIIEGNKIPKHKHSAKAVEPKVENREIQPKEETVEEKTETVKEEVPEITMEETKEEIVEEKAEETTTEVTE